MNTVFGDNLIGWTNFPENQLLRCKDHKFYEGKLLLNMPIGTSFLDIGSHYGDTVLTMALYAKNNNRNDIRFFAFEPNIDKYNHIKSIASLNNLNITVYNCCVGNSNKKASNDNVIPSYCGATSYTITDNGEIDILKLNDIKDIISPVGIMHIDTEGWELSVLQGASEILNDKNNDMYIIAECWDNNTSEAQIKSGRAKGIISSTPENDIINEMSKYSIIRLDNIIDEDRNLVFKVN